MWLTALWREIMAAHILQLTTLWCEIVATI
jgi:hypothetical protein